MLGLFPSCDSFFQTFIVETYDTFTLSIAYIPTYVRMYVCGVMSKASFVWSKRKKERHLLFRLIVQPENRFRIIENE